MNVRLNLRESLLMRPRRLKAGAGAPSSATHQQSAAGAGHDVATVQPLGIEHYGEIEARLGYTFIDKGWLERALTHRSAPSNGVRSDYEQLEFLGDAVFDLAVAHLLLDTYQDAHEGALSKMRAALVNTASLADVGRRLSLSQFIKLSRGELAGGAHERPSILADVVEAVLGAVYREAGFSVACECIARLLGDAVTTVIPRDPKTELQEILHARGSAVPVYKLECMEGPEHSPQFNSIVEIEGEILGRGKGSTKKASQQAAAEEALEALRVKKPIAADQAVGVIVEYAENSHIDEGVADQSTLVSEDNHEQ